MDGERDDGQIISGTRKCLAEEKQGNMLKNDFGRGQVQLE